MHAFVLSMHEVAALVPVAAHSVGSNVARGPLPCVGLPVPEYMSVPPLNVPLGQGVQVASFDVLWLSSPPVK